MPASTAITSHGDYTDAWVRDNVYSILAVWGLGIAYQKFDDEQNKTHQLNFSVTKLMRGLLMAMMKQADKVEKFKNTQHIHDALHAKYNTKTGEAVVGDQEWGHLQLDATSLYLLMLSQMTASGLQIIYTLDEVNFIQNLVHYISRSYRTPDYGIWERGNKINHGIAELNASSIGMAKAALEAMDGFNLFGPDGGQSAVIHVNPDSIARARITLEFLLPRESLSKETDAALLSIIGFPAFAIEDTELVDRTRQTILDKLCGQYGCKRFLLDGHQTVLEDPDRLHYEPSEMKAFENIESEWPLFFTYLILDGMFREDKQQTEIYLDKITDLFVESDGFHLLPELYYVSSENVEAEKLSPGSQVRQPNDNLPLVWAQSLYLTATLIRDQLLDINDLDPLCRRHRIGRQCNPEVMVLTIADNSSVKAELANHGITSQLTDELAPFQIRSSNELVQAFYLVGTNKKLNLTGRPLRPFHPLTTSHIYLLRGEKYIFLPDSLDEHSFYLALDDPLMVERFKSNLAYLSRHWDKEGNPLIALRISEVMIKSQYVSVLLDCLQELQSGICNGIPIRIGNIEQLSPLANTVRIDYLHDFQFSANNFQQSNLFDYILNYDLNHCKPLNAHQNIQWQMNSDISFYIATLKTSTNLYEHAAILKALWQQLSPDTIIDEFNITVRQLVEQLYNVAGSNLLWPIIRESAGLLGLYDESVETALVEILMHQKPLAVGRSYTADAVISKPLGSSEILEKINTYCSGNIIEAMLNQEIILYIAMLLKSEPQLFDKIITIRSGHLLQLIIAKISRQKKLPQHESLESVIELAPHVLLNNLRDVLQSYQGMAHAMDEVEGLKVTNKDGKLCWIQFSSKANPPDVGNNDGWRAWRQHYGIITRTDESFFTGVWNLLVHCQGLIIGDRFDAGNCLDTKIIHGQMTRGEKSFALTIDHLLNKITAPEYRHLSMESLSALVAIFGANPDLYIDSYIVIDSIIGHAVRQAWIKLHPQHAMRYNEMRNEAWASFYSLAPNIVADSIMAAYAFLLHGDGTLSDNPEIEGTTPLSVSNHLDIFLADQDD